MSENKVTRQTVRHCEYHPSKDVDVLGPPMTHEHFVFSELLRILQQLPPWAAETVQEYRTLLSEAQAERDALQARVDGALLPLKSVAGVARHWAKYSGSADKSDMGCVVVKAIEILAGEG